MIAFAAVAFLSPVLEGYSLLISGGAAALSVTGTYTCSLAGALTNCVILEGGNYYITVPDTVVRMDVSVTQISDHFNLYGRLGSPPALSGGNLLSDFSTDSAISLTRNGNTPLNTGTYYLTGAVAMGTGVTQKNMNAQALLTVTLWQQGAVPNPAGVNPPIFNGSSVPITFYFNDPQGWQDLNVVDVLINNFLDGRQACYLAYSRPQNVLYLVDDAGGALLPGSVLNASGSAGNSQCTVSWGSSPVATAGNTLALTLTLGFNTSFAGIKVVYLAARDVEENNSGWQPMGVLGIPGSSQTTTTSVAGVSPARGSGSTSMETYGFAFGFSDTKGYQDLGVLNILVNDSLDGRHACYLAYSQPSNTLFLVNDNGDALLPGRPLSASGALGNSQCTVTWSSTPAAANGANLLLTLNITFSRSFGGSRIFYMAARDAAEGNNTGWQSMGTWTVQ